LYIEQAATRAIISIASTLTARDTMIALLYACFETVGKNENLKLSVVLYSYCNVIVITIVVKIKYLVKTGLFCQEDSSSIRPIEELLFIRICNEVQ